MELRLLAIVFLFSSKFLFSQEADTLNHSHKTRYGIELTNAAMFGKDYIHLGYSGGFRLLYRKYLKDRLSFDNGFDITVRNFSFKTDWGEKKMMRNIFFGIPLELNYKFLKKHNFYGSIELEPNYNFYYREKNYPGTDAQDPSALSDPFGYHPASISISKGFIFYNTFYFFLKGGLLYSIVFPSNHFLDIGVYFQTFIVMDQGNVFWEMSTNLENYGQYFEIGLSTRYYF